jgi:branched-chain amino acid aminotransferase
MVAGFNQEGAVCIEGELFSPVDAGVSVFDRGFLYGDSAFEVMRTYNGKPFMEQEHLERLKRSCAGLLIPFVLATEKLSEEIHRTIQRAGLPECYVRVVVTRGAGPIALDPSAAGDPLRLIYALPLKTPAPEVYQEGIAVGIVNDIELGAGRALASGVKSSNYLNSVLALHAVMQRGCQEAVVTGCHGEIKEGASSNLFIVSNGALLTPPRQAGILGGITRSVVMSLAGEFGLQVREALFYPSDLYGCQEAFITSSIREIVPVTRADGIVIGEGRAGEITGRLLRAYRARAGGTA